MVWFKSTKKEVFFWSFRIDSFGGEALFLKEIFFEEGLISKGAKGVFLFRGSGANSNDAHGSSLQKGVFFGSF